MAQGKATSLQRITSSSRRFYCKLYQSAARVWVCRTHFTTLNCRCRAKRFFFSMNIYAGKMQPTCTIRWHFPCMIERFRSPNAVAVLGSNLRTRFLAVIGWTKLHSSLWIHNKCTGRGLVLKCLKWKEYIFIFTLQTSLNRYALNRFRTAKSFCQRTSFHPWYIFNLK